MSRKANPKLIGGFVIGGIALLVVGLLAFGGASFLRERHLAVAYFEGSLQGLRVGATVTFRGVPIGQVTNIKVLFEERDIKVAIPVVFELDPSRVIDIGESSDMTDEETLKAFVERGFRAQLELESLVTGLLSINLNFFENAPPVEPVDRGVFALDYPEVPTMPSDMERLQADAGDIARGVTEALNRLNTMVGTVGDQLSKNQGRIDDIVKGIADFANALGRAQPLIKDLLEESTDATAAIRRTAETADALMQNNQESLASTLEALLLNATALGKMADQINNMVAENREGVRDFSQTGLYEITGLAQDAQRMADQITRVMEDLERDPARFLFGNRTQGIEAQ